MRLFVAVVPPTRVLAEIAALDRPDMPGVRWTTADQWHVTLRFLGEVEDPEPVVAALDDAALVPTTATLGPRVTALGRGVLVVPVAGLGALAGAVVAATAGIGRPAADRPFRGHLTLARARRGASVRALTGAAVAGAFPVDAVRLVRSRLGPGGARYDDVHVRRLVEGTHEGP